MAYLIEIHAGDAKQPLLVQDGILHRHSNILSSRVLMLENARPKEQAILRYPNDSYRAWACIVDLMLGDDLDRLWSYGDQQDLAEAWVICGRDGIPKVQDQIMLMLLRSFHQPGAQIWPDTIHAAFKDDREPRSWSEIKQLVVEEAVKSIYYYKTDLKEFQERKCDELPGLMLAIIRTHRRFMEDPNSILARFNKQDGEARAPWEDFMVEGGLGKMLQLDENGKYQARSTRKRKWAAVDSE